MNRIIYWYSKIYQLEHILIGIFPGHSLVWGFPDGTRGKASAYQCQPASGDTGEMGSTQVGNNPWSRKCHPLQYACLENSIHKGAWRTAVWGCKESGTTERQSTYPAKCCVCVLSHSVVTSWTLDHQVPLSVGFFQARNWSRLPFSTLGDLSDPGIEPPSPEASVLAGISTTWETLIYARHWIIGWMNELTLCILYYDILNLTVCVCMHMCSLYFNHLTGIIPGDC